MVDTRNISPFLTNYSHYIIFARPVCRLMLFRILATYIAVYRTPPGTDPAEVTNSRFGRGYHKQTRYYPTIITYN